MGITAVVNNPTWHGERLDLLKQLWAESDPKTGRPMWSASLIGVKMGISKGSVIGAVHRNKLGVRESNKTKIVRERRTGVPVPRVMYRQYPQNQVTTHVEPEREIAFEPLRIPFLKIRGRTQCRALVDERGDDGLAVFCGHRTVERPVFGGGVKTGSYCAHHASRYFTIGRPR